MSLISPRELTQPGTRPAEAPPQCTVLTMPIQSLHYLLELKQSEKVHMAKSTERELDPPVRSKESSLMVQVGCIMRRERLSHSKLSKWTRPTMTLARFRGRSLYFRNSGRQTRTTVRLIMDAGFTRLSCGLPWTLLLGEAYVRL